MRVEDMSAAELVHRMLVYFQPHLVSRDRHGDPDELDTMFSQCDEYTDAALELEERLKKCEPHGGVDVG